MTLSRASKIRGLTLQLLRTFVAVVETRQITLAAQRLNLTQSAVSQQIKKLETLFDTSLIKRGPDELSLTHKGEQLLGQAYALLDLTDELFNDMHKPDYACEIRLGVPTDIVSSLLPPVLQTFREKYPDVLITLVSNTSHSLHMELEAGRVDIALFTESLKGHPGEYLLSDQLVWVGRPNSELTEQRPLSVALGMSGCAFSNATRQALHEHNIPWRTVCQVGGLEAVYASLRADMAIGVFLSMTVPQELAILDNHHLPPLPVFHLNMQKRPGASHPMVDELAEHIYESLGE